MCPRKSNLFIYNNELLKKDVRSTDNVLNMFIDNYFQICKQISPNVLSNKMLSRKYAEDKSSELSESIPDKPQDKENTLRNLELKKLYYSAKRKKYKDKIEYFKLESRRDRQKKIPDVKVKRLKRTYKFFQRLGVGLLPSLVYVGLILTAVTPLSPVFVIPSVYLTYILSLTLALKTIGILSLFSAYLIKKPMKRYIEHNDKLDKSIDKANKAVVTYERKFRKSEILLSIITRVEKKIQPQEQELMFKRKPAKLLPVSKFKPKAKDRAEGNEHHQRLLIL